MYEKTPCLHECAKLWFVCSWFWSCDVKKIELKDKRLSICEMFLYDECVPKAWMAVLLYQQQCLPADPHSPCKIITEMTLHESPKLTLISGNSILSYGYKTVTRNHATIVCGSEFEGWNEATHQ